MNNPESIAAALNKNGPGSRTSPDSDRIAEAQKEIKEGKGFTMAQFRKWLDDKCEALRKKI